ncbi:uncharacterized protein LOC116348126 [Contarinia nasturtii]|uniref:uncharacterized protein LOC116348126 n=1 Tax=Contarinia nasturtii TaxID=265458 RepID=UPI0012D48C76|nr:uncharacterized protein LOC116348126 [Contarinia nasturtii]
MLSDIDTPTLPFGLSDVHGDGTEFNEGYLKMPQPLNNRLRVLARHFHVSLASLCHLAWAKVLACTSGNESVVFGTVLLGRLQSGEDNDSAIGLLINTLPLRLDINDTTVENAVRNSHSQLSALLMHEHASLALAQRCSAVPTVLPLFSAILNCRHKSQIQNITELSAGVTVLSSRGQTNYPITLSVDDDDNSLSLTAQVVSPISATRICGYMQQALASLVDTLTRTPEQPIRTLIVMPPEEREMLLHSWNRTKVNFPPVRCLHQLFEAQVDRNEQAIAVECEGEKLNYGELNAQANQLAHYLIANGVKPDDRIAVCVERNPKMIVAFLGILKAGGAYMPLDPTYSSQRLTNILQDANPLCLLADASGRAALGDHQIPVVNLKQMLPGGLPSDNPDPIKLGITQTHLAYIIYTSGSSGTPKGVMIEHESVINLVYSQTSVFKINANSRMLQFASCAFDTSICEIVTTLTSGACLCLPNKKVRQTDIALLSYLSKKNITHAPLPPAFFRNSQNLAHLNGLKSLILSGETPPLPLLQTTSNHTTVLNVYGPTETTIIATIWSCPANFSSHSIPIGRPMSNVRVYLLDAHGEPVPLGVEGEIYIGGAGVARGYMNRPDLTAERFLPDPFSENEGARMYRTGDLAHYLPDGNLVYMGRTDHQIKIYGFRIEPGEIEARLMEHPRVQEAVVLLWKKKLYTDCQLIAYVVAERDTALAQNLRNYLTALLPNYMVPAAYVCLSSLPLTPNGKLDRRALPDPDDESFARQPYEAPQGKMEEKLAAIWRELLGIKCISRHDNFFALGGHSLMIVRMLALLRQVGLDATVQEFFDTPSLAAMAEALGNHKAVSIPPNLITTKSTMITPDMLPLIDLSQTEIDALVTQVPGGIANIQDIYGLAPLQEGILFHNLMSEKGDPYLLIFRLKFSDREKLECYVAAMQQVIERHDILRTVFIWEELSEPAQVVLRQIPSILTEIKLDDSDEPVLEQLRNIFNPIGKFRLDLTQPPLLRLMVTSTSQGDWAALLLMHHLISDHTTLERLNGEVQAIMNGHSGQLTTPKPFRHVVAQARLGVNQDQHPKFFKEMLADVDTPTLPFGLSDVHGDGTEVDEAYLKLPQELNNKLRTHARHLQVSLASLCHLAWAQVLSRASRNETVVFGTVLFGRSQSGGDNDSALGMYINTLPLRFDIDDTSIETTVRLTHTRLSSLLVHEHASLALAQRCSGVSGNQPLFSADYCN